MEDYAAKMALKSDAALREYVTGHAQYRDEAVLAALAELRQRGQPAAEEESLRPQLEAAVQQAQASAAPANPEKENAELPSLYSPAGIVVMSAMISVIAGAVLLALNFRKRNHSKAIYGLAAFVLAYLVVEALVVRWLAGQHLLSPFVVLLADLPLIVAFIWWFWPRYVGTYQFQPRNWLLPLGACLLVKLCLTYVLLHNPTTAKLVKQQMEQLQQR